MYGWVPRLLGAWARICLNLSFGNSEWDKEGGFSFFFLVDFTGYAL